MADRVQEGSILINGETILPSSLWIFLDTEEYSRGWRLVKNFDSYALTQKVTEEGWLCLFTVGRVKARAFGFGEEKTTRKAIDRLLADLKPKTSNGLEITEVSLKSFLELTYVSVSARRRNIQKNVDSEWKGPHQTDR